MVTHPSSVGNDLELKVAKLTRLLGGLVLYASLCVLVRLAISLTVLRTSSDAERDLEILALRHQVTLLSRQVKRPELLPTDRLILAAQYLQLRGRPARSSGNTRRLRRHSRSARRQPVGDRPRVDSDVSDHEVTFELSAEPGDDALDSFATLEPSDAIHPALAARRAIDGVRRPRRQLPAREHVPGAPTPDR